MVLKTEEEAYQEDVQQQALFYRERYVSDAVGSAEDITADSGFSPETPGFFDLPEGLTFVVGQTRYARVGDAVLNLENGKTVDHHALLRKRKTKHALALAVVLAGADR